MSDVSPVWLSDVLAVLQRVSEHFADTDAPLGIEARRLHDAWKQEWWKSFTGRDEGHVPSDVTATGAK